MRRSSGHRRARLRIAGVVGVVLMLAGSVIIATGVAFAAVNCDSVFQGATPSDPIIKTADKTQAFPGQTVTFTLTFKATGTASNVTADCYRVDSGGNATLNALVTGFNAEQTNPNVGGKDSIQHVTYTITIPNDTSLIGHAIVDRAKATSGSVESRSDLISVDVIAPVITSSAPPSSPPPASVKGVTLGKTGSSAGVLLTIGVMLALFGLGTTAATRRGRSDR